MDPIADMLTSIRNAQMAQLPSTTVPASKTKAAILAILKRENYIEDFKTNAGTKPTITIELRYDNRRPAISHIRRISKPGLRVYRKRSDMPRPLRGMGIAIVSTPQGVVTDKEARKLGVGGELLCEVW
jgi:small subunit ribosomal protein S8